MSARCTTRTLIGCTDRPAGLVSLRIPSRWREGHPTPTAAALHAADLAGRLLAGFLSSTSTHPNGKRHSGLGWHGGCSRPPPPLRGLPKPSAWESARPGGLCGSTPAASLIYLHPCLRVAAQRPGLAWWLLSLAAQDALGPRLSVPGRAGWQHGSLSHSCHRLSPPTRVAGSGWAGHATTTSKTTKHSPWFQGEGVHPRLAHAGPGDSQCLGCLGQDPWHTIAARSRARDHWSTQKKHLQLTSMHAPSHGRVIKWTETEQQAGNDLGQD